MAHRLTFAVRLSVAALVTLGLAGCNAPGFKSKVNAPSQTAKSSTGQTTTTASAGVPVNRATSAAPPSAIVSPGLTVSDAIAHSCGISPRGTAIAPSFDFDSAALAAADREVLANVAKCLTEGPLKGKNVVLIGRADVRGEPEYNMTLGGSRADAVHRYLVDLGVAKDQLRSTSRGELDATGTDDAGWANDRRV
ncbi:MAG TPA: OmpA family protein, partial [Labilithrix sp.]|nr:OmpA family protein [Labilithrix sp.]